MAAVAANWEARRAARLPRQQRGVGGGSGSGGSAVGSAAVAGEWRDVL